MKSILDPYLRSYFNTNFNTKLHLHSDLTSRRLSHQSACFSLPASLNSDVFLPSVWQSLGLILCGSQRSRAGDSLFFQPPVAHISWQLLGNKCLNEIINEACQTSAVGSIRAPPPPVSADPRRTLRSLLHETSSSHTERLDRRHNCWFLSVTVNEQTSRNYTN